MFHYDQNTNLSYLRQEELIDEGERSRLAAEATPRTRITGAVFAYALRKLGALEQAIQAKSLQSEPHTSTQEVAAVR